jgi:hypothetical protein
MNMSMSMDGAFFDLGLGSLNIKQARGGGSAGGAGIGTTLLIIGAVIVGVFGFILALVFGAQLSSTSLFSSLPTTNQTKINANIGNGVVAGSAFVPLIYLGGAGALSLAIFSLIFLVFRHLRA